MKPKLTAKNRAIVEKALRAMLRWPKTVDMALYVSHDPTVRSTQPHPYCGTTACIAGHIVLAATGSRLRPGASYRTAATKILGLKDFTDEDSLTGDSLFHAERWPNNYRSRYWAARGPKTRAKIAVARVRHWLKTGE